MAEKYTELMKALEEYFPAKWVEYLMLAWFLTLPFGSHFLSVSVGFMTLNPNLVISFILFVPTVLSFRKWSGFEKLFSSFLLVWLICAVFQSYLFSGFHEWAIFDLRSLALQFIFCCAIFGGRSILGNPGFFHVFKSGLVMYMAILFLSGIVEWFTSAHFKGVSTEKLMLLSPSNTTMHAPMFIYDNVNDYLMYLISLFLIVLLFSEKLRRNQFAVLSGWLVIYVFSVYAQSRFGNLLAGGALILTVVRIAVDKLKHVNFQTKSLVLCGLIIFGITIAKTPVFKGPAYDQSANFRINEYQILEKRDGKYHVIPAKKQLSEQEQKELANTVETDIETNPEGSSNLRKNLLLNGLVFIHHKPVFGIGAGNYRKFTDDKRPALHFTGTVNSAHFFPVEIISQFGLFGWGYFAFVVYAFVTAVRSKLFNTMKSDWLLFLFIALPVIWSMSSSFLYSDLHRILVPIIICMLSVWKAGQNSNTIRE